LAVSDLGLEVPECLHQVVDGPSAAVELGR